MAGSQGPGTRNNSLLMAEEQGSQRQAAETGRLDNNSKVGSKAAPHHRPAQRREQSGREEKLSEGFEEDLAWERALVIIFAGFTGSLLSTRCAPDPVRPRNDRGE